MFGIILSFVTAFTLTYFAIPPIIHIAKIKNLCDEPGERRSHTERTPSLGGIGIFAGLVFSVILWTPFELFVELQYILCAFIIIFLIGAKDDIVPLAPMKKLIGQVLAASILVFKADIRLSSLYGIMDVYELSHWVSYILSIFTMLVVINAFNLIDGINGLSGSIGTLISLTLGIWFYLTHNLGLAILAFAMAGSIVAFLRYNFTPAQIFMGDTGALLIGLVCSILVIRFIEINGVLLEEDPLRFDAVPAVAIGILILPLFDTLRVFTMRAMRGRSPLSPDRNHIHHLLIDLGLSHMRATLLLVIVNILFMILVFALQGLGTVPLLFLTVLLASGMTGLLYYLVARKEHHKPAL